MELPFNPILRVPYDIPIAKKFTSDKCLNVQRYALVCAQGCKIDEHMNDKLWNKLNVSLYKKN